VVLGNTVTTEFANNHPSLTLKPNDSMHTSSGFSRDSATAVADRMVPLARWTQFGSSVIRPACYRSEFAVKQSFCSIERQQVKFLAESLETIGVFARCAKGVLAF
jgi:Asp-tRNA(Asn)/Glu-tRNA(Gln) amidotransferase A subunit family amidase